MKIAINTVALKSGHKTRGIGSYIRGLLEEFKKNPEIHVQEFTDLSEVKDADIVHYPLFDLFKPTLPLFKSQKTVVTIHDLTPLLFPDHYPPGIKGTLYNVYQKIALKGCSAIITDSISSKKDISGILNVNKDTVFVIHLAPSGRYKPITDITNLEKIANKYNLPIKFALFTGSVNWNKNIINLTKACLKAKIDLVLVGKDFEDISNLDHPEKASFKEFLNVCHDKPQIHLLGFIPDDDLVTITNLSFVQLLPSFYEGFGLPILEAQACGVPVITSKTSSMPEIGGGGAIYVDPENVNEISEAIIELSKNHQLINKLIKAGFENTSHFSWKKTAAETLAVYQHVLQK